MTPIEIVGGLFGLFAVGLIVLLIYKSTLTMHEDDQLFLDDANSHMQEEQTELLVKVTLKSPLRSSTSTALVTPPRPVRVKLLTSRVPSLTLRS